MIEGLAYEENKLIEVAASSYGSAFKNADELVDFTKKFVVKILSPSAYIFIPFLSLVQNSLSLSLLSAIRRHDVQTQMMLRQALEAAVLACYGLHKPDDKEFILYDDLGLPYEKDDVVKKARKWLEKSYKGHSDKIKYMKDQINSWAAHANILIAINNFKMTEIGMNTHFFDEEHKHIITYRLWWIANIAFGLLDLFVKVINAYPLVKVIDNFHQEMARLIKENEEIKNQLKEEPRFKRWKK